MFGTLFSAMSTQRVGASALSPPFASGAEGEELVLLAWQTRPLDSFFPFHSPILTGLNMPGWRENVFYLESLLPRFKTYK